MRRRRRGGGTKSTPKLWGLQARLNPPKTTENHAEVPTSDFHEPAWDPIGTPQLEQPKPQPVVHSREELNYYFNIIESKEQPEPIILPRTRWLQGPPPPSTVDSRAIPSTRRDSTEPICAARTPLPLGNCTGSIVPLENKREKYEMYLQKESPDKIYASASAPDSSIISNRLAIAQQKRLKKRRELREELEARNAKPAVLLHDRRHEDAAKRRLLLQIRALGVAKLSKTMHAFRSKMGSHISSVDKAGLDRIVSKLATDGVAGVNIEDIDTIAGAFGTSALTRSGNNDVKIRALAHTAETIFERLETRQYEPQPQNPNNSEDMNSTFSIVKPIRSSPHFATPRDLFRKSNSVELFSGIDKNHRQQRIAVIRERHLRRERCNLRVRQEEKQMLSKATKKKFDWVRRQEKRYNSYIESEKIRRATFWTDFGKHFMENPPLRLDHRRHQYEQSIGNQYYLEELRTYNQKKARFTDQEQRDWKRIFRKTT